MSNDTMQAAPELQGSRAPEPMEEELYAALRAAGASAEEAEHCCQAQAQPEA